MSQNQGYTLILEDGGMASVRSAGMLKAFHEKYGSDSCSYVFCSGVSTILAILFLKNRLDIFKMMISEQENMPNLFNVIFAKYALDIPRIIDEYITPILTEDDIADFNGKLNIACTDISTSSAIYFDKFNSVSDFIEIVKGACTIPVLTGRLKKKRGKRIVSSLFSSPIAVPNKKINGDIIIVLTFTEKERVYHKNNILKKSLTSFLLCFVNLRLAILNWDANRLVFSQYRMLKDIEGVGVLELLDARPISRGCDDLYTVRTSYQEAYEAIKKVL